MSGRSQKRARRAVEIADDALEAMVNGDENISLPVLLGVHSAGEMVCVFDKKRSQLVTNMSAKNQIVQVNGYVVST